MALVTFFMVWGWQEKILEEEGGGNLGKTRVDILWRTLSWHKEKCSKILYTVIFLYLMFREKKNKRIKKKNCLHVPYSYILLK